MLTDYSQRFHNYISARFPKSRTLSEDESAALREPYKPKPNKPLSLEFRVYCTRIEVQGLRFRRLRAYQARTLMRSPKENSIMIVWSICGC